MSVGKPALVAIISHELCVGTGMCVGTAPMAFGYNSEGLGVFIDKTSITEVQLREAADACPMAAISLVEAPP